MKSFSKKYNKGRKFEIDTTGFEYYSLEELYEQNGEDFVYPIHALYINTKGHYGDSPVVATEEYFVNFPSHMLDVARDILDNDEAIELINNGEVGFRIYKYTQKKYNRECYAIDFVDM